MLEARTIELAYAVPEGEQPAAALRGASLRVAPGEVVALVGANGVGKSSLARVLCGSVAPQTGEVLLNGGSR